MDSKNAYFDASVESMQTIDRTSDNATLELISRGSVLAFAGPPEHIPQVSAIGSLPSIIPRIV